MTSGRTKPRPKASAAKAKAKKVTKTAKGPAKSAPAKSRGHKWVYTFGDGAAEGQSSMRNLLGGKGANLAEMANLKLPVPPGFTITTELCTHYYANKETYPAELEAQVAKALDHIARITGKTFGD